MEGRLLDGRYEIIQRVGGGGMAVVYKAKDILLGRYIAVKVMNPSLSNDEEYIQRFNREAKNAASLSHPNVVGVYDVGQEKNIYYLVMEYIDGPSLKELIEQRGAIPPQEAIEIAIQIGEGLAHAHQMQIVHRDIKPHNIMVAPSRRYKVTDFGIARSSEENTITQTGSVMGSVHYFSPEQARGGEIGYPSDLYSFGVLLYEMVTGTVPFDGDSAVGIALKHLQEPPPDPRHLNPNLPDALCNLILKAMEKDPRDRFASATEMINALQNLRASFNKMEPPSVRKRLLNEEIDPPKMVSAEESMHDSSQAHERISFTRTGRKKNPFVRPYLPVIIGIVGVLIVIFIGLFMFQGSFAEDDNDNSLKQYTDQNESQEEQEPIEQSKKSDQPSQPASVSKPKQVENDREKQEEEYPWWEKMPHKESSEIFSNPRVNGENGEYQVTLKVDLDDQNEVDSFYYNVVSINEIGEEHPIITRHSVPIQRHSQRHVYFVILIPQESVPVPGGVYAEVYLSEHGQADMIRFPLEANR